MVAQTDDTEPELRAAAVNYARNGRRVLPLHSDSKRPIAALVPHGLTDATDDPHLAWLWWAWRPAPLIGLVVPAGMVALDLDPRHGGTMPALEQANGGPLPDTVTCWSGRRDGGRHLYYRAPLDSYRHNRLPPGVDLRVGTRAYCVAPPSPHPATGHPYTWAATTTFAPLPTGLLALIKPVDHRPIVTTTVVTDKRVGRLLDTVRNAPDGKLNTVLYWAACRAAELGIDPNDLVAVAVSAGHPQRGAERTVQSAFGRRS